MSKQEIDNKIKIYKHLRDSYSIDDAYEYTIPLGIDMINTWKAMYAKYNIKIIKLIKRRVCYE